MEREAQPAKVQAVVSFDKETARQTQANEDRNYETQNAIKNATRAAVVAASIYALISLLMWCEMKRQNRIAFEALTQNNKQWRSQHAPLLGIQNNSITVGTKFTFAWNPRVPNPGIYVGPISYKIKNVGGGPALHEWDMAYVLPLPSPMAEPEKAEGTLCPMKGTYRETEQGQFILQGEEIGGGLSLTNLSMLPKEKNIKSVEIMVCLSYEDAERGVHHSRFIFETTGTGNKPITPNPAHPEWTYIPPSGLYLKSAQTDYGENPN